MKKKIAILLAAVMTATMAPMNVFAGSSNSISKTVTVKDDDLVKNVFLKVQPSDEIFMGDSIVLNFENAEIVNEKDNGYSLDDYAYQLGGDKEYTWGYFEDQYNTYTADKEFGSATFDSIFKDLMVDANEVYLPYSLERNSKRELEVKLFPLPGSLAGETYQGINKPCYYIPMAVVADGEGDITVTIDANSSSISGGGTYKIATSSSTDGSTTTTIDDVLVSSDEEAIEIDTITIKESVQGTFKPGKTVTLKLNSGFEFDDNADVKISAGTNAKFDTLTTADIDFDDNSLTFTMPNLSDAEDGETEKAAAIKITGLYAKADNDDDFGEVKITISGNSAGITKETIVVAEFGDYGITAKAVEDPTTIYAGRVRTDEEFNALKAADDYEDYMNADVYKQMDKDDFETAAIEIAEVTSGSWSENRALTLRVPEGVKIFDWEIDEEEDFKSSYLTQTLSEDGEVLKLKASKEAFNSDAASFEITLYVSADPTFTGDVNVAISGAGTSEGDIEDVKIAEIVAPVTVTATTTKTNMGYQKVPTSDIVITEAADGVLLKNGEVKIALDSVYGSDELGFADENIDYEITGDLEVKSFKVNDGVISFTVDSESSEASTITIKNVQIGTTRSVPMGSYGLKISGNAIVNNYSEDLVDEGCEGTDTTKELGVGFFDDNEEIKVPDYIKVVTETGTLDSVVKVTIGEKTILVNDEAVEIDVAPYIQQESSSTMVPLRFVMVALGVDDVANAADSSKVQFDGVTKTATITYAAGANVTYIQFQAGSNIMKVNGVEIPMDNGVKAEITDSRMFVPFRAIGNALGVSVSWDEATRTAIYNAQ